MDQYYCHIMRKQKDNGWDVCSANLAQTVFMEWDILRREKRRSIGNGKSRLTRWRIELIRRQIGVFPLYMAMMGELGELPPPFATESFIFALVLVWICLQFKGRTLNGCALPIIISTYQRLFVKVGFCLKLASLALSFLPFILFFFFFSSSLI